MMDGDKNIEDRIVDQTWRLFELWYHLESHTEEYRRVRNGLFELLKESDSMWVRRVNSKYWNKDE